VLGRIARWGAPAAIAGGSLWLLVWAHGLAAHGPGERNEKDVVAGLTWMDSGKALVACFLLFLAGALLLAIDLLRMRARGWWLGLVLAATGPASFFLTPVLPLVGAAWLLVGIELARLPAPRCERPRPSAPAPPGGA
jgi:hypothetical protein